MKFKLEIDLGRECEDVDDIKLLLYRLASCDSLISADTGSRGVISAPCSTNTVGNWSVIE